MSAQELITNHLDLWSGAITQAANGRGKSGNVELTGIRKLRELILDLAVRGKLAPQSPSDTSFREMLLRLRQEHAATKKNGRRQKKTGDIDSDERPFAIPESWDWARLGELTENFDSQRKPITKSSRKEGPYPYFGASGIVDYVDDYLFDESLVLVGEDGAKWGKGEGTAFLIKGRSWVNNHAHVIRPKREVLSDEYLVYFLTASDLNPYITGMTVPKLNQARLASIPVAIPSLEEQHRIVQKVDELMALCDRLEQQTSDHLEAHETLVETLLSTLTQSENNTELADNWVRVATHLDSLFTTEQSIDKLTQTILKLGMMGLLTNSDDQSNAAAPALNKIKSEKEDISQKERIKEPKIPVEISEDEKPFELPLGWKWARVGEVIAIKHGYAFKSTYFSETEKPFVLTTPGNFHEAGGFRDQGQRTKYYDGPVDDQFILSPYDMIIPLTEQAPGLLGSAAFIPDDGKVYLHNQRLGKLLFSNDNLNPRFIYWFFNSRLLRDELSRTCSGTTVRHSSPSKVSVALIPIPARLTQDRVVQKIDSLMSLCDQLKERLRVAAETRYHLAEAVVDGALH